MLSVFAYTVILICVTASPTFSSPTAFPCTVTQISPSQTPYTGLLDLSDCEDADGSRIKVYRIHVGSLNDSIDLQLDSAEFPPRIDLYTAFSPGAVPVRQGTISGARSGISSRNLSGQYDLVVRSALPGTYGPYSLKFTYIAVDIFPSPKIDFNGDLMADIAVFRRSNHTWYVKQPGGGVNVQQFGEPGDMPVAADFDGDLKTDIAVFRGSTGTWFIVNSQTLTIRVVNWGEPGDVAFPVRDNCCGGAADFLVYRPSTGTWYRRANSDDSLSAVQWGRPGDKPVIGPFDGSPLAVFRPSEGRWYFHGSFLGNRTFDWGQAGDIPVTSDFDWDGKADIGVFRPATGQWFLIRSRFRDIQVTTWGEAGDVPVSDDYSGTGRSDLAVYRPSNNRWYIASIGPSPTQLRTWSVAFGEPGDVPVAVYNYHETTIFEVSKAADSGEY